jgi:hypothetical protein
MKIFSRRLLQIFFIAFFSGINRLRGGRDFRALLLQEKTVTEDVLRKVDAIHNKQCSRLKIALTYETRLLIVQNADL